MLAIEKQAEFVQVHTLLSEFTSAPLVVTNQNNFNVVQRINARHSFDATSSVNCTTGDCSTQRHMNL
jgi:hypothetical protein